MTGPSSTKSLRNGTKPTAPVETICPFSASEICAIIRASHHNGVSSLKLGALHVEFQKAPEPRRNVPAGASQPEAGETAAGVEGPFVVGDNAETVPQAPLSEEDKELLEDARLAQLMTDNPEAYEQEIIDALQ